MHIAETLKEVLKLIAFPSSQAELSRVSWVTEHIQSKADAFG